MSLLAATVIISHQWGTGRLRDDYGLRFRAFDLLGHPHRRSRRRWSSCRALYWLLDRLLPWNLGDVSSQARTLTDRAGSDAEIVLLVLMVVVGAPIIEELFFRGLLMRSIQARWNDGLALVVSALFFSLVHFQPLQFPGCSSSGWCWGPAPSAPDGWGCPSSPTPRSTPRPSSCCCAPDVSPATRVTTRDLVVG